MTDTATTESTPTPAVTMGDAASGEGAVATTSLTTTEAAPPPADFKSSLGDFASDPSFEAFKDAQSLAKAYKDTKALVGKKFGPPSADASDQEKADFYKSLGVPEKPEDYGFKAPENIPEELAAYYNEESLSKWAEVAKKHNLTPDQANGIREWYDNSQIEAFGSMKESSRAEDAKFMKMLSDAYGNDKDAVIERTSATIAKYLPADVAEKLTDAPAPLLSAVVQALENQRRDLSGEDKTVRGGTTPTLSLTDLKSEMHTLMRLPEYSNPMAKGREAHDSAVKRVREIANQIALHKVKK